MAKSKAKSDKAVPKQKSKRKSAAASILDDVEDLLENGYDGLSISDVALGEELPAADTQAGDLDTQTITTQHESQDATRQGSDEPMQGSGNTETEPSVLQGDTTPPAMRVLTFDELVALAENEPMKINILLLEYTTRQMLAQERIATAFEHLVVILGRLEQLAMITSDAFVRTQLGGQ